MYNMEEYVKRKDVAVLLENATIISDGEYSGYCTEDVSLGSIPAADVAPVRHGHWLLHDGGKAAECSQCSHLERVRGRSLAKDEWRKYSPFCCLCGAKMDGGEQK